MKSMQAKLRDVGRKVVHVLQSMQSSRMPRGDPGSAAQPCVPSVMAWDSAEPGDQRHAKIRLWRRRALAKRGAWLHTNMPADAQSSSLAMLDETGIIVCWYGSPDGRDYAGEEVVGRHVSLFYVSEEVSRRQPCRDLRAAIVDGHLTRRAWRRRLDGSAYCGTFFVEPLILRDGRVQGFSYISSAAV